VGVLNACASVVTLEEGGVFMSRSFRVVASPMSLWGIAWCTCMQNVGTWKMLGECSTRCHFETWSLDTPYLEDVPCMGMVRKLLNILNICVKKVYSQLIPLLFIFSQLVAMQVWWMEACAVIEHFWLKSFCKGLNCSAAKAHPDNLSTT
jgi:hypothetical protein